jgi:hypothetical protein
MGDTQQVVIAEFLRPLMDYWMHRDERRAVEESGRLRFWRDGMLRQLEQIANGTAKAETFELLKKNLEETAGPVRGAMEKMRAARDKLGTGKLADEIDAVLNSDGYGKEVIRMDIKQIIANPDNHGVPEMAKELCNRIGALNAALDRLRRMVYDE